MMIFLSIHIQQDFPSPRKYCFCTGATKPWFWSRISFVKKFLITFKHVSKIAM